MRPIALITGAGRGIGRATAMELTERGYRLALVARTEDQLQETAIMCGGGLVIPADVSDAAAVQIAVDQVDRELGSVDVLVNCAGVAPAVSIEQMTPEQWRQVIDTNLSSAFYLSHAVWPIFKRQRSGVVVNISSLASRDPFPGFGAYGAAKAGLNLLTTTLHREGRSIGVRAHAIAPGAVETEMFRGLMSKEQWPTEKTLSPEAVAKVIGQCVGGDLQFSSGEVIYLSR